MAEHGGQAAPIVTQCGCRLACSPPLALEQGVEIEPDPPLQPVIDRPGQLRGEDRQGLALPVFVLSAGQRLVAHRMVAEAQDRRFGQGPLEIGVAALGAGGAIALPGRFLGAFDHAALGHEILDPGEAGAVRHLIHKPETQELAHAWDGLEPVQGVGLRLLRRLDHGQLQIPQPLVILVAEGEVSRKAFLDRGSGKPLSDSRPVGLVRDLFY